MQKYGNYKKTLLMGIMLKSLQFRGDRVLKNCMDYVYKASVNWSFLTEGITVPAEIPL